MNSIEKQCFCLGGRHMSNTYDTVEYDNVNPKTKKFVKIRKRKCGICNRSRSQIFLSKGLEKIFLKKKKLKNKNMFTYVYYSIV